jgi:hypothetical protein
MTYYNNLYLPSISKNVQISEIKYGDYSTLQKFLLGNDVETILPFLDYLIKKYVKTTSPLSALDKFICLLYQRVTSLHGDLELPASEAGGVIKIDLNKILEGLLNFQKDITQSGIMSESLSLHYPLKFSYETKADYIYSWISNLDTEDASVYSVIKQKIEAIESKFSKIDLYLPKVGDSKISLDFSNGVLLELLKLYLKTNLMDLYEKNHFLLSKASHTLSDLNQLSPAEVNIYFALIEKELKAMSEANKTDSIPLHPK